MSAANTAKVAKISLWGLQCDELASHSAFRMLVVPDVAEWRRSRAFLAKLRPQCRREGEPMSGQPSIIVFKKNVCSCSASINNNVVIIFSHGFYTDGQIP